MKQRSVMAKTTRRPQRIFSIVMWVLSIVFAGFLMALGDLIIRDIPSVDRVITLDEFVDAGQMDTLVAQRDLLADDLPTLQRELDVVLGMQAEAEADYRARREAFDNWIATRSATQAADTNPEVIVRTRELERLTQATRVAERDVMKAQTALADSQRSQGEINRQIADVRAAAEPAYRRALNAQELRIFGFRLMLTLPLLLAAGWMIAKKRQSAYWPLYRGFVLFALYAFFFELVRYLPSYGGYVRNTVGILVVIVSGHFLIRQMRAYLERKQAEEARTESERRKSIDYETALKKIAAKTCPGCDRAIVTRDGVDTDYCVHCGIHLQRQCHVCGTRNITFHRFCLACGAPNMDRPETQSGAPPAMA